MYLSVQVSGRNLILFVVLEGEPRLQTKPAVFYLFVVWSLVEIIRWGDVLHRAAQIRSGSGGCWISSQKRQVVNTCVVYALVSLHSSKRRISIASLALFTAYHPP